MRGDVDDLDSRVGEQLVDAREDLTNDRELLLDLLGRHRRRIEDAHHVDAVGGVRGQMGELHDARRSR